MFQPHLALDKTGYTITDTHDNAYLGCEAGVFVAESKQLAEEILALHIATGKTTAGRIDKIRIKDVLQYANEAVVAFSIAAYASFKALAKTEGIDIGEPNKITEQTRCEEQPMVLFSLGQHAS